MFPTCTSPYRTQDDPSLACEPLVGPLPLPFTALLSTFSHENSSHFCWLVVSTPLKNISQLGFVLPNIWKKKTCSKPPTSQPFIGHWVTDLQGSHGSPPAPHTRPQPWSGRWVSRRPEAPGMEVAESARKDSGTSPTKPEITWDDFPTKTNQSIGFTYHKHGS